MGKKYLIDTNVIVHLFADKLPVVGKEFVKNIVDVDFIISVATEIEILTFRDGESKVQLIEEFVNMALILPLDKAVTKKAIELRRNSRKLKLGDAIIGATALVHELILITNNTKDFVNIKNLQTIDPNIL